MIAPVLGKVGHPITLEGYADDFGNHIVAIEFTLDDGKHWASQDTSASDQDLMVHWTYTFTPKQAGTYVLKVRSVTDDGRKSPTAAHVQLIVEE